MTARLLFPFAGLALTLPLLACVSLPSVEAVQAFTLDDEWKLGARLAPELDRRLSVHPDAEAQRLLDMLGRPLAESGALEDREWRFTLVDDAEPFTFHAPGGQVYVSTGLVDALENDSQFTGLLAHQVAHAHLRHGMQLLNQAHGPRVMLALSRGERRALRQDLAANLAARGTFTRFARASEAEADEEAIRLLVITGREHAGLLDGMKRLSALGAEAGRRPARSRDCHRVDHMRTERIGFIRSYVVEPDPHYRDQAAVDQDTFHRLREKVSGSSS